MKHVKLNQLCEINIGKTPSRSNPNYWGRGHKWLSIADMKRKYLSETKEEITDLAVAETSMKIVPKNTVLMSFKLSIGKVGITKEDMYTNEAIASFPIIEKDKLIPEYLFYALKTIQLDSLSDRAVMGSTLNKAKLNKIMIPLPSIDIQFKIVDILNKAENLIDKRKAQIEALEQLTQSVFLEMFGDPIKNPKNYKKVPLGELYEIKSGGTPSRSNNDYWNGEIPWVKTTEVNEKVITYTAEFISEEGLSNSSAILFPKNTILIAMYGQGKTRGRTAMLGIEAATNQACAALLPNNEIEQDFMWKQLMFQYVALRTLGRGGNQPNLNLNLIKQFEVIVPPVAMQKEFVIIVENIEKNKRKMEQSMAELDNMFHSFLHLAFKGELFTE